MSLSTEENEVETTPAAEAPEADITDGLPSDPVNKAMWEDLDFGDPSDEPDEPAEDKERDIDAEAGNDNPAGDDEEQPTADVVPGEEKGKKSGGDFSDDLLRLAAVMGIPEERAKGFSSPDSLRDTLRFLEQQRQLQPPQGGTTPAAKPEEPPTLEDLALDLDDFDEAGQAAFKKVADHFSKLKSHYDGQTKQLTQAVTGLQQLVQHQAAERLFDEFDQFVVGLGKNFADKLGEGDRFSGKVNQEQGSTRAKILEHAAKLANGKPLRGYYKAALNAVLGDKTKEIARKEVAAKLQKRAGSSVTRPTNRTAKDERRSPEQRAVSAVAERLKEFGAG